jgi:hypothetical protein|tara:strand:- start:30 stop:275 length:246 start_codon:yes stop_codon:yes gene_type:complete
MKLSMYDIRRTYSVLKDLRNTNYSPTQHDIFDATKNTIESLEDIINEVNTYTIKFNIDKDSALQEILEMDFWEKQKLLYEK